MADHERVPMPPPEEIVLWGCAACGWPHNRPDPPDDRCQECDATVFRSRAIRLVYELVR